MAKKIKFTSADEEKARRMPEFAIELARLDYSAKMLECSHLKCRVRELEREILEAANAS